MHSIHSFGWTVSYRTQPEFPKQILLPENETMIVCVFVCLDTDRPDPREDPEVYFKMLSKLDTTMTKFGGGQRKLHLALRCTDLSRFRLIQPPRYLPPPTYNVYSTI